MRLDLLQHLNTPYYFLSALRGPDLNSCASATLKDLITARLRGIFYHDTDLGLGSVLVTTDQITAEDLLLFERTIRTIRDPHGRVSPELGHFLYHLGKGLEQVKNDPIWRGTGLLLSGVLLHCDSHHFDQLRDHLLDRLHDEVPRLLREEAEMLGRPT